ncbi:MAG: hypothetical protein OXC37_01475 [Bdellovibrionaceae bacterium]|nr:hypothetical protein [Pseudobdellovibrionaceae bacterium]
MKYFFIFLLLPFPSFSMKDEDYEKWIHKIYLKNYKDPISNSEWNNRVQNLTKNPLILKYKDNLWDLSATILQDPLFWSKLWVINPKVENPNLIYQGDPIKFDPTSLSQINKSKLSVDIQDQFPGLKLAPNTYAKKALSEEQIPSSLPKIPLFFPLKQEIDFKQLERRRVSESFQPVAFYLSDNIPTQSGVILSKDGYGRFVGVSGDKVVLRLTNNVPIGTYFTVFKNRGRLGNFLSRLIKPFNEYEIQIKGILKVVSYLQGTGSLYKARVVSAIDNIVLEDLVFRGQPDVYNFSDKKLAKGEGSIVGSPYKSRLFLTVGSIVFLDKGSEDGIYKESAFYILPNKNPSDFFKRPYNYEGAILGKLKVIKVSRNKSTAVILSARDNIYVGDAFSGRVSPVDMERIEEVDIIDEGQDLLIDFEEDDEVIEAPQDKNLEDFEEITQQDLLEDPDQEEDQVLQEDFEGAGDGEIGADFEIESEDRGGVESLEDYEKDIQTEENYEVDVFKGDESLSERKKQIDQLNEELKDERQNLENLEEDITGKELEFNQLENQNLEEEIEQAVEDNEGFEFEEIGDDFEDPDELAIETEDEESNELEELEEIDVL